MKFAIVIGNTSGAKFAVYSSLPEAEAWLLAD